MKKAFILACILCLLCSSALANTIITNESESQTATTTVSYTIEANKEYTVTIPASVTIGDSQTATMTMSVDASEYQLNPGNEQAWFYVFLTTDQYGFEHPEHGTMFYVTNGTDKIGYTMLCDYGLGAEFVGDCGLGRTVLAYGINPNSEFTYSNTSTLTMTAYPTGEETPGDYTATLTFQVDVGES